MGDKAESIITVAALDRFKYRIDDMGAGSEKFGLCEVCMRHCNNVFKQTESREVEPESNVWTEHDCMPKIFGHVDCLIGIRKK